DETYTHKKLEVYELVPETERAWHAGKSYWAGKSALNDHSIGIEVVNQTYCEKYETHHEDTRQNMTPPPRLCFYPDFPESQIALLIDLLQGVQERHPRVDPVNIIGHSDIAPDRKIDPGPRFPWERLYQVGIGAWFDDATVTTYWKRFAAKPMPLINVQKALHIYGYKIDETGQLDEQTRNVLRAFQMHFRPSQVSGEPTLETTAILFALIEKYRPRALDELLTVSSHTREASP
ncbi:MAG TPA: N-acetylmuramoyl-L-alanine amidase, partial [Hellea balneolensis]|nr:N-acetylmuramoyl-L-alanine amidase [Hellea balneolensis]